MNQFEYIIIEDQKDGSPNNIYELNKLGKEGWELTSQTCRSYWAGGLLVITDAYILKRRNK